MTGLNRAIVTLRDFAELRRGTLVARAFQGHQLPDAPRQAPCRFVRDTDFPLQLFCSHGAIGRTHQVDRVKPFPERHPALRENGPGQRINLIPAATAGIGSPGGNPMMLPPFATFHAMCDGCWPALLLDVFKTQIVILKLIVKVSGGVASPPPHSLAGLTGPFRARNRSHSTRRRHVAIRRR